MCVEKVLFANPFFHVSLVERNGLWSAEIGNRIYYWNCTSRQEAVERTMQKVLEINESETRLFFQQHFAIN